MSAAPDRDRRELPGGLLLPGGTYIVHPVHRCCDCRDCSAAWAAYEAGELDGHLDGEDLEALPW